MRFAILLRQGTRRFVRLDGGRARALAGPPWLGGAQTEEEWAWDEGDLGCPVAPSKIVCVGRNYAAHAKEMGHSVPTEPLLFLKPPSSLLGPGGRIRLPPESTRVEHEAELGVVIGERCSRVPRDAALAKVFGYTCAGDITARDLQKKDVQFTRAKGFDTFCPVGPWIETELDPASLAIRCRVNDQLRQDGVTSDMIFDVATLVAFASAAMTLEAGDLLLTGTPEGVGPLSAGDALEIEVVGVGGPAAPGIGVLRTRVG